jgi:hypothetical protein
MSGTMSRWRLSLLIALFIVAALLLFIILYALLARPSSNPNGTPHHHHHHHHHPTQDGTEKPADDCGCQGDDAAATGTGTHAAPELPVGPPPLSMPFLDYLKQPGMTSIGMTPASHPTEWAKIWSSGALSHGNLDAPRIEFYFNDYCPACKRFKPMWDEAVSWFPARLQRVLVSCGETDNALPCAAIQKIPTVIFRRSVHEAGVVFTAPKTKESLLEFVNSNYQAYLESC